ncbi:ribonuclease H-like domain-containing protein [Tanacetum coccineum]
MENLSDFIKVTEDDRVRSRKDETFCPCKKYRNGVLYVNTKEDESYLIRDGFTRGYTCWDFHGEKRVVGSTSECNIDDDLLINNDRHDLNNMLYDLDDDAAQKEHAKFEKLFLAAEKALFGGCTKLTILSMVIKLFKIEASFEIERIDACQNDYMLYRGDDKDLLAYKTQAIICRCQGGKVITLACEERKKGGKMRHVADSLQWRNIDNSFEEFGGDIRNIGYSTKGKKACPVCEDCTHSVWLRHCRKTIYMGHRRSLLRNHPYRKKKELFDGTIERGVLRPPLDGEATFSRVRDMNIVLGKGKDNPGPPKGIWKKKSIFWDLAYWEHLQVRHCLDIMHIEKIAAAKVNYWNIAFVPSGYSANIKKLVSMKDLKLSGMKSHDCHVLMTQMIPIAIRGILPNHIRHTITKLCLFFNMIHSKVIDPEVLDKWQHDVILTLCQLEMYFPPSFFDVMVHLVSHIVREIKMCGPPSLRNMYPFERYMGYLKGYVRNRSRPEWLSLLKVMLPEEVIDFHFSLWHNNYLRDCLEMWHSQSRNKGRLGGVVTLWWRKEEPMQSTRDNIWLAKKHNQMFSHWLKEKVKSTLLNVEKPVEELGFGLVSVVKYEGYDINEYTLYTRQQDQKSKVQNSGVTDVKFYEIVFPFKMKNNLKQIMFESGVTKDLNHKNFFDYENLKRPSDEGRVSSNDDGPELCSNINQDFINDLYGNSKFNSETEDLPVHTLNSIEPTCYEEATLYSNWIDAMNAEIKALNENHTCKITDLPPNMKAIGNNWIYKIKYKSSGDIDRYKARLVVKGELDEDIYMTITKGFASKDNKNKVCKLVKSLYGLKQAPRKWNEKLVSVLKENVITRNCVDEIDKFKIFLKSKFKIKDLGHFKYFLGIDVIKTGKDLCLSQRKYCLELLKDYGLLGCKPVSTRMEPNSVLPYVPTKDDPLLDNIIGYQKLLGKLIYLTHTRSDITYYVHCLAQFINSPLKSHLNYALNVLRYLKGASGKGIRYVYSENKNNISGYSDAY